MIACIIQRPALMATLLILLPFGPAYASDTTPAPQLDESARPVENSGKERQILCTEQYAPVCGEIGSTRKTYSNRCFARAGGAVVIAEGPCDGESK
jgi:hypothetical protein